MKINNTFKLIIAIVVSEAAGIIGSVFTMPSIAGWYAGIIKPTLNPPAWVFGPVWAVLFALMGISAFLIWSSYAKDSEDKKKGIKIALVIFIGQLVLNTLWSIIFFGRHNPGGAFIEIIFLWFAILATIVTFAKISKPAAWLLLPYILWVSFAGYLNYSIWQLNGTQRPEFILCTQEAKLCSDGSYVGRTGPNCEFTSCPVEIVLVAPGNNWPTFIDNQLGLSFQYPEKLTTEYITAVSWPPKIQIIDKPFTCAATGSEITATGSEITAAGQTLIRTVDNRTYCLTKVSEGAAGSIYTDYTYTFSKDNRTLSFVFSLRAVQCANYDDPQKTACEQERESFDLDGLIDRLAQTVKLKL